MRRTLVPTLAVSVLMAATALLGSSNSDADLETFFSQNIGLTRDQIAAISQGQAVTKALPSRTPAEVFLFGAVHIHAAAEDYVRYAHDFDRLRKLPGYLDIGVMSNPPRLSDFKGFALDDKDIQALEDCKPGDCLVQVPSAAMDEFKRSINWSASDVDDQVNQLLQKTALERLLAYQRQGNQALGTYDDKRDRADVPQQFAYMLSYSTALPARVPDFYQYLLSYPNARPTNTDDLFYWTKVKFGLKPTLRIVQVIASSGPTDKLAYAVAEKQLYSSHYFETALDLTFCIRGSDGTKPGFYLTSLMGSEQAGLTGPKGSIVRKTAIGRSLSNLQAALAGTKNALEGRSRGVQQP